MSSKQLKSSAYGVIMSDEKTKGLVKDFDEACITFKKVLEDFAGSKDKEGIYAIKLMAMSVAFTEFTEEV